MTIPGSVLRAELRRRRSSLVVLVVLVAFVVAAVAGALAGARRTSTSVDRFREWAHASDGGFQLDDRSQVPGFERRLRSSGRVTRSAERLLVNAFLQHEPITDIAILSDPRGRYGRAVDGVRVLSGRMPRAGETDTIALDDLAARLLHAGPGHVLSIRTWSPDDLRALFGGQGFPGLHGPRLRLRVVGLVRTLPGLTADVERASATGLAAPGFTAAHPGLGVWPPAVYVRTTNGTSGFEALGRYLGRHGFHTTGTPATDVYVTAADRAAHDTATGLLVFAVVAAVAGAFVVCQAVLRHLLLGGPGLRQLVDLGMTRSQAATVATIPITTATAAGALLGAGVAAIASPIFPIGLAGRAEIAPGILVDVPVLLACALGTVVTVTAFALLVGRSAIRRVAQADAGAGRPSTVGRLATRLGIRPTGAMGVHLATERHSRDGPVPVRSALVGVAIAVAAVVGVGVVAHSETQFRTQPERWGRTWHSEPDVFGDSSPRAVARVLGNDPDVAAFADLASDTVQVEGRDVPVIALTAHRGDLGPAMLRGRAPTTVNEIALGAGTLDRLGAGIGDTVRVRGHDQDHATATRTLTVTGVVVTAPSAGSSGVLDAGASMSIAALHRLIPPDQLTSDVVLRYRPGADVTAVERRLARAGLDFNPFTEPQVPGVVRRLTDTRTVAVALGWFFALLGALGLLHAAWVGSRRHRRDFAVLRVLGMRRRQVSGAVLVAALLLAIAATVVGVPLGLVLGRAVWRDTTSSMHALTGVAAPWGLVLVLVPATLIVAALVAWWPARRAGRADVASALRSE